MAFHTFPYVYVFFLIETPFYHYQNKDVKNLYKSLMAICKVNFNSDQFPLKSQELQTSLRYPTNLDSHEDGLHVLKDEDTPNIGEGYKLSNSKDDLET